MTVQNDNNNCKPVADALVDVWHCDNEGNYSEYGGGGMQPADHRNAHFLRGRQKTNAEGNVSFISIYPGWYPGRAPHIHVEIFDKNSQSLLVTQVAFPEDISSEVYKSEHYKRKGQAGTSNKQDGIFRDSLDRNMSKVTGNEAEGYKLSKSIVVKA
ncbi:MAG: hypothetical protein R2681_13640 [Pyrinomonadaceae bacterium]